MRKLLIIASLLAMTAPTLAQSGHYRHESGHYRPEHRGGGGYLPGILLGLGAAAAIGSLYYYNGRQCWDEFLGTDVYGNQVIQRRCN